MDEVEFQRAYNNLRVLIESITEVSINETMPKIHIRNALLTIAAMLDGLNQRITELQLEEDDE